MMPPSKTRVAVIGGGVSGIATAHFLMNAGYNVHLYEASEQLGGRMAIDDLDGHEVCFGGKNIGHNYQEFRAFIARYSTPEYEYFGINSARLSRGQIKAFNSRNKIQAFFNLASTAQFSDLWKLRKALKQVKRVRCNGDLSGPYFQKLKSESYSNIASYFSPKFSDKVIRALTVRMNGAEPDQISLENLGTHLQMLRDEYDQLISPVSELLDSFAKHKKLRLYLNHWVEHISRTRNAFQLSFQGGARQYETLILATPAHVSAELTKPLSPSLANCLEMVNYNPVGVIVAQYRDPVFSKEVRALTFEATSSLSNMGAYGIHDLHLVRYTFSGRAAHEILHETLNEEDLLRAAEALAMPYFNLAGNPCLAFKMKYWPRGLCGYAENQTQFQTELDRELANISGLYLTGDYLKGNSIENCFRAAKSVAATVIKNNETPLSMPVKISSIKGFAHV